MSIKGKLTKAAVDATLVRVYRENLEPGWAHGYVEVIGKHWFALNLVDDGVRFNGFNCFRIADVSKVVVPDPHADFLASALKKRGEKRPRFKALDLSSLASLIRAAAKKFPLLTVHLEVEQADVCYIGRVVEVGDDHVILRDVAPDGKWRTKPDSYALSDITRVDFGGAYEQALYLVAGEPK